MRVVHHQGNEDIYQQYCFREVTLKELSAPSLLSMSFHLYNDL